ncbi:MAG: hypothetical protein ACI4I6_06490 [Hominimerdicola sp.]
MDYKEKIKMEAAVNSKNIEFFREKSALFFKGMDDELKGGD